MVASLFVVTATFAQKGAFTDAPLTKYEISKAEQEKVRLYNAYDDLMYNESLSTINQHGDKNNAFPTTEKEVRQYYADQKAISKTYPGYEPQGEDERKAYTLKMEKEDYLKGLGYNPIPEGWIYTGDAAVDEASYAAAMYQYELDQAQNAVAAAAGYKPVPFFKYTGNKSVDDANYAKAIANCQKYDPITFYALFN